jgi:hypothetical protein
VEPIDENPVSGIISTAIAKAEKNSIQPGQENVSLLQQYSTKSTPASTQFTFTCESQVPGTQWPGPESGVSNIPPPVYAANNNAAKQQQMASSARNNAQKGNTQPQVHAQAAEASHADSSESAASRERKLRRQINRELEKQARDRRRQAQEESRRNPPTGEDLYVCDLCMYQRIFGREPKALIRMFEEKVRQERIDEELRRQRLERAKARGRKGKKPFTRNANDDKPAATQSQQNDYVDGDDDASVDDEGSDEDDGTSQDDIDDPVPFPDDEVGTHQGDAAHSGGGGGPSEGLKLGKYPLVSPVGGGR